MEADPEIGLRGGGPQGQAGLLILPGHRPQGRFRHVDDGGQHHNGQHQDGRQQTGAGPQGEGGADQGHQHDHAHQAVYHRRDARQQLHGGADHGGGPGRGQLCQEDGRHQADGHADDHGPGGAVYGGEDEGENAVLGPGGGVGGVPDLAEQEFEQADLADGGQAREDQIHADDQHEAHGHDAAQQEDQMDHGFQGLAGPCIL